MAANLRLPSHPSPEPPLRPVRARRLVTTLRSLQQRQKRRQLKNRQQLLPNQRPPLRKRLQQVRCNVYTIKCIIYLWNIREHFCAKTCYGSRGCGFYCWNTSSFIMLRLSTTCHHNTRFFFIACIPIRRVHTHGAIRL